MTAKTAILAAALAAVAAAALWGYRTWTTDGEADSAALPGEPMSAGAYEFRVAIEPAAPRVGDNRLTIQLRGREQPLPQDTTLRAVARMPTMPAMPVVPVSELKPVGPGRFTGTLPLSMAGRWELAIDAQSETLGHGDLVLDFETGRPGLGQQAATPAGISHWTCSMHPSVHSASEGSCPICGMDLVPVSIEEVRSGTIMLDAARRQLIGVTTAAVRRAPLTREIRAVGTVSYDETRMADVALKFDAWIGELHADATGMRLERGQTLFTVYGPELLAAQEEYLETRRRARSPELIEAARKRLGLWDIGDQAIAALERRGRARDFLPIAAPISGTLIDKAVVEGAAVKAGSRLMRIADLSRVWVDVEVYEADLPLVDTGMPARVTLPYLPGEGFQATVDHVYPYLEHGTRTGRLRLVLDNPDGRLKPAMYAEVRLTAELGERLLVPEEAVLYAGDSRVVFVDRGEGKLEPRRITTGRRSRDDIEVLEGLAAGEQVVTSGNFLIAAETRLKAGIKQW